MFRILWDPSSGSTKRASLKLLVMFCVRIRCLAAWNLDLWCVCLVRRVENYSTRRTRHKHHRSKFHVAKHRLRTQNITSNFSEARL